jgi:hypothetical protein
VVAEELAERRGAELDGVLGAKHEPHQGAEITNRERPPPEPAPRPPA